MNTVARYLISTADERTWKFDRPVIFLGEWCRVYDRKHIWQDMDAIVAPPYGLGQAKKDADHAEARALEEQLFPVLCATLNRHHGTQHGPRFWRIVLGHWLRRYVDVMLNRVKTLEQCLQRYQISGTTAYANDHYALATQDSNATIWASSDERWNNALTVRILDLLGTESCPVDVIAGCVSPGFRWNALATTPALKRKVLKWCYQRAGKLASYLAGADDDAFIISSYLPKKEEIKLQLTLGQCPQLWVSPKHEISAEPDRTLRESLANQVTRKPENNLKDILSVMIFELLPVCYLESFADLNKLVKKQPWPTKPKFILTSNSFDTDEVFKLWAANKAESGSTYITGQHGNNYGTHRYIAQTVEEATADKFLTWGWTDGLPQNTPAFIFKTAGKPSGKYNLAGGLLLIETCLNHRITTWDGTAEFDKYFEEQQRFINGLEEHARKKLTVRLHAAYRHLKWDEEARWKTIDPTLQIDTGNRPILELIAGSRLVVHSYDSTGILETLSQNIPTMAFWQNGFDHLRENATPHYQLLIEAGIIHLNPLSVAKKVNAIWGDVDSWWTQSKVQDARMQFCERYARTSRRDSMRNLKKILMSNKGGFNSEVQLL